MMSLEFMKNSKKHRNNSQAVERKTLTAQKSKLARTKPLRRTTYFFEVPVPD
jgi:hypothetical protein